MSDFDDDEEFQRVLALSLQEHQNSPQRNGSARDPLVDEEEQMILMVQELSRQEAERERRQREAQAAEEARIALVARQQQLEREREARRLEEEETERALQESLRKHEEDSMRFDEERETEAQALALAMAMSIEAEATRLEYDHMCGKQTEEELTIPSTLFHVGKKLFVKLGNLYGVKLRFYFRGNKLVISGTDADIVAIAKFSLAEEYFNSALEVDCLGRLNTQLQGLQEERVHIFIDNSNIYLGSRYVSNPTTRKVECDFSIRIKTHALSNVIIHARSHVEQRIVYGSSPPRNNAIWKKWEEAGYSVCLFHRTPGMGEQLVDDALVARINNAILTYPARTLVLLTGDGNGNDGRVSFHNTICLAIQHGWKVELWAWKVTTSAKYYELARAYEGQNVFSLNFLDDYRDLITYQQRILPILPEEIEGSSSTAAGAAAATGGSGGGTNPPIIPAGWRGTVRGGRNALYGGRVGGRSGRAGYNHHHHRGGGRNSGGRRGLIYDDRGRSAGSNQSTPTSSHDEESVHSPDEEEEEEEEEEVDDWMNCPITLTVMRDPVRTVYGHYFERSSLLTWLEKSTECPFTRQPLRRDQILPPDPEFLRQLQQYHAANPENTISL